MKRLLLINTRDLADLKLEVSDNLYLVDKLTNAEVIMEESMLAAIVDMIEDEEGEESSFIYNTDYDEDIEY